MPLRRTERSDGRTMPRWKDGSHVHDVESTRAHESRRITVASERTLIERLGVTPWLLPRDHEPQSSTRERPAHAGADARMQESVATGDVRLAILPYGRAFKLDSCRVREVPFCPMTLRRTPGAGEQDLRRVPAWVRGLPCSTLDYAAKYIP